jgi:hypothetical protein
VRVGRERSKEVNRGRNALLRATFGNSGGLGEAKA